MINQNEQSELLELVKLRLGISSNLRDKFLIHLIDSAISELQSKSVLFDYNNKFHQSFIVDYSCFKYKNNDFNELPRFLRYQLNNLILGSVRNDI